MVPRRTPQRPCKSWVTTYHPCCTTASESQHTKLKKAAWGKDIGPTRGFTASPRVGPGATVGTLRTGYPCVQAPSQDKGQGRLACPRVWRPWLPPTDLGQLWGRHVSPVPASRLGAAPRPPPAPVAPSPTSRLGAALGPPCVTWALAPTFWLRAAPELSCAPRKGSTGCKQLNKYPLATQPS
jgi:hypothetical protein